MTAVRKRRCDIGVRYRASTTKVYLHTRLSRQDCGPATAALVTAVALRSSGQLPSGSVRNRVELIGRSFVITILDPIWAAGP